ncbi:MAG: hypothetical protein K2J15_02515 [Muribaculaceae bacterium]|nr:hypothetical protein [Muribaculaceae bacterium]
MFKTFLNRLYFSSILLIAGLGFYILWRPEGIFNGKFTDISHIINAPAPKAEWIIYSFPDACWYMALLGMQPYLSLWSRDVPIVTLTICAILLPFIHEAGQLTGLFPGSFSISDLISYFIISAIYLTVCIIQRNQSSSVSL